MGYPQLKHYDVLDDLYNWEEDLQESLEVKKVPTRTGPCCTPSTITRHS